MGKDSLLHDLILSQYKEVIKPLKESKRVIGMVVLYAPFKRGEWLM